MRRDALAAGAIPPRARPPSARPPVLAPPVLAPPVLAPQCASCVRRLVRRGFSHCVGNRTRTGGPATDQRPGPVPQPPGGPVRGKVCLTHNRHKAVIERNL